MAYIKKGFMGGRCFTNYSKHSGTQAKQSEKIIKMLLNLLESDEISVNNIDAVLDAGCGDGEVTEELFKKLKARAGIDHLRLLGIDKTAKRLRQAKKRHKRPEISYAVSDIPNFSSNTQFDLIFSNAALHWVNNQQKMYSNFNNLLRRKGVLAVHQGAKGSYIELHNIAVKTARQKGYDIEERRMPPAYLSPKEANQLLENNGFNVVDLEAVEYPMDSEQIVRDFAEASLSKYFEAIGEKSVEEYKKAFIENGVEYIRSGGSVAARRLYFTALIE